MKLSPSVPARSRARLAIAATAAVALLGCEGGSVSNPSGGPAAPENPEGRYHEFAVELTWELSDQWDGESFRVYGKRASDPDFFLIAEVTSCAEGFCLYTDLNVLENESYEYQIVAVDQNLVESAAQGVGPIEIPEFTAPPVPGDVEAIALDGTLVLKWGTQSRQGPEEDFLFYKVYLDNGDGTSFLLGETDSEGFVDLLVENGTTYGYFVTAVDEDGHESQGSELAEATPRPDFSGEFLTAFEDAPETSGFVFQETELDLPIVPGDAPGRHFRLEADQGGWWLAPGPGVEVHGEARFTTALRCDVGADEGCEDRPIAPLDGYTTERVGLEPELSYVVRVPAGEGDWQYGVIRVTHVGLTQQGAIILFDWAFQLQPDNRNLAPPTPGS